jgi:uncharacterized protein YndB with AHSA1/START domain
MRSSGLLNTKSSGWEHSIRCRDTFKALARNDCDEALYRNTMNRPEENTTLVIRKIISASAERLFAAWTEPEQLKQWWGPESVTCVEAEVDLRVGGHYRIGNQLPDGKIVWISGSFRLIDRPHKLVYSWRVGADSPEELVTVTFRTTKPNECHVTIMHERIPDRRTRDTHEQGWLGCLTKLASYIG